MRVLLVEDDDRVAHALVPEDQRRTAYSLDSIIVELCFMVGPLVAVALSTQVSTTSAMTVIGVGTAVVGTALYVFNPPVRGKEEQDAGERPPRQEWLTSRMVGVLL
ncbi:MFS transporter, partial [Kibdelosporangium lantanae]